LVGISDITALQLSLWKHCRLVSVHGSFMPDGQDSESLRKAMMTSDGICLRSRLDEPTSALTTEGTARGRLIGGSLLPMSKVAGWALPSLKGAILLKHFKIPILGGVPVGHGYQSQGILVGTMAFLDAGAGTLTISGTQA
jgi:muramoyltetrapeptide carboxypeptidase LdcA involved in peptidoglycan recycling